MKGKIAVRWGPIVITGGLASYFIFRATTVTATGRQVTLFDDAMISMRYARNLAGGHGLVYNVGSHPVQGYTNLLWTLWMTACRAVPDADRWAPLAVAVSAVVAAMLTVDVNGRIAALMSPGTPAAGIARWGTAVLFPLIGWSVVGMEVAPLALLLSLAALLVLRWEHDGRVAHLVSAGTAVALAILVRTDAVVPGVILVLWCAWPPRRRERIRAGMWMGAWVVGGLAITTVFSLVYYGHPFPNTYYLKISHIGLSTRVHRGIADLMWSGLTLLAAPLLLGLLAFAVREYRKFLWLPLGMVGAQLAYSVYAGGDSYDGTDLSSRFVVVVVPLLLAAASVGVVAIARSKVPLTWIGIAGVASIAWLLARAFNSRPGQSLQLGPYQAHGLLFRALPALLLLAAFGLSVVKFRYRFERWNVAVVTSALAVSVIAGAGGLQTVAELHRPDMGRTFDSALVHVAIDLRRATDSDAVIASGAIGQIGYFTHRDIVDLLGYTDSRIAMRSPSGPFIPGHDKFDIAYSVGMLKPDILVASVPFGIDAAIMRSYGYRELAPSLWVKAGSTHLDLGRMGPLVALLTSNRPSGGS